MKGLRGLVISLCLLLIGSFAYSQSVCFDELTAGRLVVQVEQTQNLREQIELYKQANDELIIQIKLLKEINNLKDEQINKQKDLLKIQKDTYEGIIKESKPSLLKNIFNTIGAIGIGVLVGLSL